MPRYHINDVLMVSDPDGRYHPCKVQSIEPYLTDTGYWIEFTDYPNLIPMRVAERYLRPLVRSRNDMRQLLKVVS